MIEKTIIIKEIKEEKIQEVDPEVIIEKEEDIGIEILLQDLGLDLSIHNMKESITEEVDLIQENKEEINIGKQEIQEIENDLTVEIEKEKPIKMIIKRESDPSNWETYLKER